MSHPPTNNYAIQCERARAQFLTYDQAAMCARLGLEMTEDAIPIRFLGEMCTIRRADGAVMAADGSPAPFGAVMAIYDALARDNAPVLSGKWNARPPLRGGSPRAIIIPPSPATGCPPRRSTASAAPRPSTRICTVPPPGASPGKATSSPPR